MKRCAAILMTLICLLALTACGRTMNDVIGKEPCVTGIVREVHDSYLLIYLENEGYPSGADCRVSLDVELEDSMTQFQAGDTVAVYYDGGIAESDPLRIGTVYAIVLLEPGDRTVNEKP